MCANRGHGEVKVQLVLMRGGGDRVVGGPEYMLMMILAVEGSQCGQNRSGIGICRVHFVLMGFRTV